MHKMGGFKALELNRLNGDIEISNKSKV